VLCDDGSSSCHIYSKGWDLPKRVAGTDGPRRFGIDGHHAGSSGDATQMHRARGVESGAAAELGPVHAEQIAQDPQQRHVRRRITVWDSPLIFDATMIDLPTHPRKWPISTRPMLNKIYQTAALCVTAKFVCQ